MYYNSLLKLFPNCAGRHKTWVMNFVRTKKENSKYLIILPFKTCTVFLSVYLLAVLLFPLSVGALLFLGCHHL